MEIIGAQMCPDLIDMLVSIPPKCSAFHGVPQREKQSDDLGPTRKLKGQRWKTAFLVEMDTVGSNKKGVQNILKINRQEIVRQSRFRTKSMWARLRTAAIQRHKNRPL